jgi:DNA-binding MarR family transcriptional regulator
VTHAVLFCYNVKVPNSKAPENQDSEQEFSLERTAEKLLELMPLLARLARTTSTEQRDSCEVLSPTQSRALHLLSTGVYLPSQLARRLEVTPASVSELVEALVPRGLVRQSEVPGDRRCTRLELTSDGTELHAAARESTLAETKSMLSEMDSAVAKGLDLGVDALVGALRQRRFGRAN